jgi:hypothetical protein
MINGSETGTRLLTYCICSVIFVIVTNWIFLIGEVKHATLISFQGVANRGASIRVGRDTEKEGKGKFFCTFNLAHS